MAAKRAPAASPPRRQARAGAPSVGQGEGSGKGGEFQFTGRIKRIGSFFGIDVPAGVSQGLGGRGHVFVTGTLDGAVVLRTSLSPSGAGRHLLFLNGATRREAGVGEGDRVTVRLALDADPRLAPPDDLAQTLRDEGVFEAFEALPTGRRNQLVRQIEAAVQPATRDKRIARAVEEALAARERALDGPSGR
jgi:uncharacterized protein DUF1905/bacteriocin resistance YdeI/OmpD-like protein